jgi:hypothetical protein
VLDRVYAGSVFKKGLTERSRKRARDAGRRLGKALSG